MSADLHRISAPLQRHLSSAPPSTYLRCLLTCAALLLSPGETRAELRAIDLDGLRLGARPQELRQRFPLISCQSFKRRAEADVICTVGAESALLKVPVITLNFELIDDRLTAFDAVVGHEHFQQLLYRLQSILGQPWHHFRDPSSTPQNGYEHVVWRAGSQFLDLRAFYGSSRAAARVFIKLTDERTKDLLRKRAASSRAQRRVGGNIAPSREQLEAGAALLTVWKRVFSLKELSPDTVRKEFEFALEPMKNFGPGIDRYRIDTNSPHFDAYRSIYSVFTESNQHDLRLSIDDHSACISEELLKQHWDNDFVRMTLSPMSSPRGFSAPRGMRNPPEAYIYTTPYGLSVVLHFEFTCASSIAINNQKPSRQEPAVAEDARQLSELIAIEPQFTRPSVDEPAPQTFVVNLPTVIPASCIAVQARGFITIVLDHALLERLSAQRRKRWRNEKERMAVINGDRARRLLMFDGAAHDSLCSAVINETQLGVSRYLVADLLAAGMAVVFHKPTSKTVDEIAVTYESNRSCFNYTSAGVHFFRYCSFAIP